MINHDPILMNIALSGCSSGGKSTLLEALARRGYACVPEPGRRIVDAASPDDPILPWHDSAQFLQACTHMAITDHRTAQGLTFFDRSLLDAACGFARMGPLPAHVALALQTCRYHHTVYLTPPWPQIYHQDAARRHGFAEAVAEYDALCDWLPHWGYRTVDIPRLSVQDRVVWLLSQVHSDLTPQKDTP
jgi:predicted ATPase